MVLVARAGALDEGDRGRRLSIRGPQNLSAGGTVGRRQALHHDVGDDVGVFAEAQVVELGGVVGRPSGGRDHRAHAERFALGLLVEPDGVVTAGIRAGAAAGGQALRSMA